LILIQQNFNDKDVDNLIEHFRDKGRRKELFKEYKELEMLYEIISPDAFLRPYMETYATVSGIYDVVRAADAKMVYVDKAFQRKTNSLVQEHVGTTGVEKVHDLFEIDKDIIDLIKQKEGGATTKVINLIKSIQKAAEEQSDDPFLIAMAERARAVQENFEERQAATAEVLDDLPSR
jgi:type I restriction enzyme R subunit